MLTKPSISELTVEDPAEAFEDLRDRNDLAMLLGHAAFMSEGFGDDGVSHGGGRVKRTTARTAAQRRTKGKATVGKLGPPADRAWLERWRKDLKMAGVRIPILNLNLSPPHIHIASDESLLIAPVPSARRDAHPAAPEPHRFASRQSLQAAGEGAIVSFQLCELQMILLRSRERLVLVNMGLTSSVYPGSTCSARGEGPLREARRDFSERLRRLSENIGDVAVMWVSFTDEYCVAVRSHCVVCRVKFCSTPHPVFQRHARCSDHGHFCY